MRLNRRQPDLFEEPPRLRRAVGTGRAAGSRLRLGLRRAFGRRLRLGAPQRPVDVERAFDADRIVIRLEPRFGVRAAEVAQLLKIRPGDVELGQAVVSLERSRSADPMELRELVGLALEEAGANKARREVGFARKPERTLPRRSAATSAGSVRA